MVSSWLFAIDVANLSKDPILLLEKMMAVQCVSFCTVRDILSGGIVNAPHVYMHQESEEAKSERYYAVAMKDASKQTTYWAKQVRSDEKHFMWKPQFIEMMNKFATV